MHAIPYATRCAISRALLRTTFRTISCAMLCALAPFSAVRAQDTAQPPGAVGTAPGVYSDSQATRGGQWYASACAACHPGQALAGPDFQIKWSGRTALDLFDRLRNSMPLDAPGSLSRRTYADIVAYLMRLNGLPAGTTALAPDTLVLRSALLTFGPAPAASPDFSHASPDFRHASPAFRHASSSTFDHK